MLMCNMSGAFCASRKSIWRPANRGARAMIRTSRPRPPRSWGSTSIRPTAVLAVDEKPSIQALERAQGYLKLSNGRALTGRSHDYNRAGTTTLFAALDIATGEVRTKHYSRRRRIEFLDFMNHIVAAHPKRQIHVILDNLNTHKPKTDRWLAKGCSGHDAVCRHHSAHRSLL